LAPGMLVCIPGALLCRLFHLEAVAGWVVISHRMHDVFTMLIYWR
jgi:hypothetical protein